MQSVFELMIHAVPHLSNGDTNRVLILPEKQKGSSIINISSVNGLQSFAGTATYCASKVCPGCYWLIPLQVLTDLVYVLTYVVYV